jgi:predicted double-glycine peptidase
MRRLLLALACCAAGPAAAQRAHLPAMGSGDVIMPVTSMRQARLAGTLLQKYDFSCGSAAVATLLTHHYGYPVTEQVVFEQMYMRGNRQKIHREGFSLLDMKNFLAAHGFQADGFEQPLDKLNEARVPAIVLINENGYHHFVVIKGVQRDRVLIGDPAQGTRAMRREAFESIWKNRLLFVIHNRMEQARFNLAADWRVAPRAPLGNGVNRDGLAGITLPKLGPGEF